MEVQWIYRTDMLSHPCALPTFIFFVIKFILSSVKVIFSNLLFGLNSEESNWLLLECIEKQNVNWKVWFFGEI